MYWSWDQPGPLADNISVSSFQGENLANNVWLNTYEFFLIYHKTEKYTYFARMWYDPHTTMSWSSTIFCRMEGDWLNEPWKHVMLVCGDPLFTWEDPRNPPKLLWDPANLEGTYPFFLADNERVRGHYDLLTYLKSFPTCEPNMSVLDLSEGSQLYYHLMNWDYLKFTPMHFWWGPTWGSNRWVKCPVKVCDRLYYMHTDHDWPWLHIEYVLKPLCKLLPSYAEQLIELGLPQMALDISDGGENYIGVESIDYHNRICYWLGLRLLYLQ